MRHSSTYTQDSTRFNDQQQASRKFLQSMPQPDLNFRETPSLHQTSELLSHACCSKLFESYLLRSSFLPFLPCFPPFLRSLTSFLPSNALNPLSERFFLLFFSFSFSFSSLSLSFILFLLLLLHSEGTPPKKGHRPHGDHLDHHEPTTPTDHQEQTMTETTETEAKSTSSPMRRRNRQAGGPRRSPSKGAPCRLDEEGFGKNYWETDDRGRTASWTPRRSSAPLTTAGWWSSWRSGGTHKRGPEQKQGNNSESRPCKGEVGHLGAARERRGADSWIGGQATTRTRTTTPTASRGTASTTIPTTWRRAVTRRL